MIANDLFQSAFDVIATLQGEFDEAMAGTGQCKSFNMLCTASCYIAIRLGDDVLWDSEDDNEDDYSPEGIREYCIKELEALSEMYSCFKKTSEPK